VLTDERAPRERRTKPLAAAERQAQSGDVRA
jgi:hypothetical protein